MVIKFTHQGDFKKTEEFLRRSKAQNLRYIFEKYAQEGVRLLSAATPRDSGETASSWFYRIVYDNRGISIHWMNDNTVDGIPVAILLQYGHGTRGGTYVAGQDFINPVMKPLFEKIADDLWKEVTKL